MLSLFLIPQYFSLEFSAEHCVGSVSVVRVLTVNTEHTRLVGGLTGAK